MSDMFDHHNNEHATSRQSGVQSKKSLIKVPAGGFFGLVASNPGAPKKLGLINAQTFQYCHLRV